MEIEQYIKFVLRFLKENKVYSAYLYNVRKEILSREEEGEFFDMSLNNYIELLSQRLHQYDSMEYLFVNSFSWAESREGFKFWEKINKKFQKEIKEIKK